MQKNNADTNWTSHLHYHWWKYVVLTALSVLIWGYVFDTLAQPEKNENIGIVFFGDGLDTAALHQELSAVTEDLTTQKITRFDISKTFADYEHLGQILMARTYDCDLLILSADQVDMLSAYGFFMPLAENWKDVLR